MNKDKWQKVDKKNLPGNARKTLGNRGGSNPRPSESQSDALTN